MSEEHGRIRVLNNGTDGAIVSQGYQSNVPKTSIHGGTCVTDIERLLAIEEIKQLKARYLRCVDTKHWEAFGAVFAPDGQLDISDDVPGCILAGRENIVRAVSVPLAGCVSVHHGHCPEIDITSSTTANGTWAMEDMLRWGAKSAYPNRTLHGYGHYVETYEKIDGQWLIKSMKLQRLRVDVGVQT
ncbi:MULTISPECIES: nuclear transport factor 2 family protein [Paraburkholderia]|uniref:Nuclear transport factor 2 family protein n=1 Tax=Paraburkholderia guartelaensis TaxID=2546446 RepID=A0ABU9SI58_9BURK|nr:nuclear transport factor 2 family protein [Paraburkholderia nodosa]